MSVPLSYSSILCRSLTLPFCLLLWVYACLWECTVCMWVRLCVFLTSSVNVYMFMYLPPWMRCVCACICPDRGLCNHTCVCLFLCVYLYFSECFCVHLLVSPSVCVSPWICMCPPECECVCFSLNIFVCLPWWMSAYVCGCCMCECFPVESLAFFLSLSCWFHLARPG